MTTFAPDQITLGAAIVERLTAGQTLGIVILCLLILVLGGLAVVARAIEATQPERPCRGNGGPCGCCDREEAP